MLIIGRWPMMEQATLDVFRRLKHALDTAEGRLETVVARQSGCMRSGRTIPRST